MTSREIIGSLKLKILFFRYAVPFSLCVLFFILYSILSIVRFNHYGAFGFDLGLRSQTVWEYSKFKAPITTIHFYPFNSILADHFEPIYIPISFFYWIWSDPRMLLLIEAFYVCFSGLAIFLLSKEKKLHVFICYGLLISYLSFYGVQHAMWFDVHSASFGAGSLAWLLYFLQRNNKKWAIVSFLLALASKENIAALTLLISAVWFIYKRERFTLYLGLFSVLYLIFIFGFYFPAVTPEGYRYSNKSGLTSNLLNIGSFYDTVDKKNVIFYSLLWFGFLPLLSPLFLIPAVGDLWNYFVIASNLTASHGLYMHYRITLAPLLTWATIFTIGKYKKINNPFTGIYILIYVVLLQYILHLPLSYLTKQWFWTEPSSIKHIKDVIKYLPEDASVVSQNNITPHISNREKIFTLWPEKKSFAEDSPCGEKLCNWFRWAGEPKYLIVDTSSDWDARHLLINREEYIEGISNLEKAKVISRYKKSENAVLYEIQQSPDL